LLKKFVTIQSYSYYSFSHCKHVKKLKVQKLALCVAEEMLHKINHSGCINIAKCEFLTEILQFEFLDQLK